MTSTLFTPTAPDVVELTLPYPPTVNSYLQITVPKKWTRPLISISEKGREFLREVLRQVRASGAKPLLGHLRAEIKFFPPDERKRDIDNPVKALIDALKRRELKSGKFYEGLFADDCQIREMELKFGPVVKDGKTVIKLTTLGI